MDKIGIKCLVNFKIFRFFLFFFTFATIVQNGQTIVANPQFYPYGVDSNDETLRKDSDDISSPELKLTIPIVFYGQQFTSVYINQNGLISFLAEIPAFVNIQFPLEHPAIVPLYTDVDTRISGSVLYRETNSEQLLEKARLFLADHFTDAVSFRPTALLIVTWDGVGAYDRKSDKIFTKGTPEEREEIIQQNKGNKNVNTFQLVVASDGVESFAIFIYDKIEWIQGTGKNPSIPDALAQAGFISGNGPFFSVKGSGTDQVSNLDKRSNSASDGVWAFRIGRILDLIFEPDENVGVETFEASSTCAAGVTICHSHAECVDYSPGFCCKCAQGYYGNGKVCLETAIPLRAMGKVKGVLNGIAIEDADLHSYIMPVDGRAYTALAKIPERIGYDLQSLSVIGTILGWLFSISVKGAPNGFQLTGGVFNYTVEVAFVQTGQKVTISQVYLGLDVFNQLKVDTRIHGTTAVVPVGTIIEVNDYEMLMTRVSPGVIRSQSYHNYRVAGTSTDNPFTIEQTVTYTECPWAPPVPPVLQTVKMKVGRNYIVYELDGEIVRYAITSKVTPPDGEDPCKDNRSKCGPFSSCVATGETFRCICNLGYEEEYQDVQSTAPPRCVDINECRIGTSNCDVTAQCINQEGSYKCQCRDNYIGDGFSCSKLLTCADVQCGANAQCLDVTVGSPECRCSTGFYGDGLWCVPRNGDEEVVPETEPECSECDPNADCIFSESLNSYTCKCKVGYYGDGQRCAPERIPGDRDRAERERAERDRAERDRSERDKAERDRAERDRAERDRAERDRAERDRAERDRAERDRAERDRAERDRAERDKTDKDRADQDKPDKEQEQLPSSDCRDVEVCDQYADCLLNRVTGSHQCTCRYPFEGDGFSCKDTRTNQPSDPNPLPECIFGDRCWCPDGFQFDDIRHQCQQASAELYETCDVDPSVCDINAVCVREQNGYRCICNPGFNGDGRTCLLQDECRSHAECGQYGECVYNRTELRHKCHCRDGFVKDRNECKLSPDAGCDILNNCDTNGRCIWESKTNKYICECKPGFFGDGLQCQEDMTGCNVLNNCARNAECAYDTVVLGFRCHCRQGFEGDGIRCRSTIPCYQDRTVCDINADCLPNQETREWRCHCKQGFNGDGFDCQETGFRDSQFLLVAKGTSLVRVPLNGDQSIPITFDSAQTAVGMDIDCPNGKVYWSDVAGREIKSSLLNGTNKTSFLTEDIGSPEGLSVDWAAQNLYWTDSLKDTIEVANLISKKRMTLIATDLVNPRGIAVYPQRGRLFWSDWNRDYPKIEYSGLDGLGRQVLIGEGLALPNSLIIDSIMDRLCFADAGTHKIECVGIDGRNRRSIVAGAKYPFGLAIGTDTFYWSDWETKSIESASKSTGVLGSTIQVSLGGPGKLYGVVLVPKTCQQAFSPCSYNACQDDYICLPNMRGARTCRCTDAALPSCRDLL